MPTSCPWWRRRSTLWNSSQAPPTGAGCAWLDDSMIVTVCLSFLAPCSLLRVRLPSLPPPACPKSRACPLPCLPRLQQVGVPARLNGPPRALGHPVHGHRQRGTACMYCLVPLVLLVPMLLPDTACAQAASRPLICTAPAPNCTAPVPPLYRRTAASRCTSATTSPSLPPSAPATPTCA